MQFQHVCRRTNLFPIEGEDDEKNYVSWFSLLFTMLQAITKDGFLCFKMENYFKALTRYLASQNPRNSGSDSSDEEDITD